MKISFLRKTYEVQYFFLYLALATVIFNYKLVGPFRPSDLFMLLAVVTILPSGAINRKLFLVILTIVGLLGASLVMGVYHIGIKGFANLAFGYKLLFPFFIPIVMYTIEWDRKKFKAIQRVLFGAFLFLTVWVYLYFILKSLGMGGSWRPTWPFTNEFGRSDGHLYSTYLSMSLVFYLMYWRKYFKVSGIINIGIIFMVIGATILTGSRTGLLIVVGYWAIVTFKDLKIPTKIKAPYLILVPVLFVVLISGFLWIFQIGDSTASKPVEKTVNQIQRAFNFDLKRDPSASARILKLQYSFHQSKETGLAFGPGMVAMGGNWYDGYVAEMNVLMGGLGVIFMVLLPFLLILLHRNLAKKHGNDYEYYVFSVALFLYFMANLITEYFLVTRNVITVSAFLTTMSLIVYRRVQFESHGES